jgi:hypothetical protein
MVNSNNLTLFVIIADGAADQICETKETAMKERADLIAMGCEVKVKGFTNWEDAQKYYDKY